MQAIEFEADIKGGIVSIPHHFKFLKNKHVRVVILIDEDSEFSESKAFSDHSAGLVQEWHDLSEDDVWK